MRLHRTLVLPLFAAGLFAQSTPPLTAYDACDINADGQINVTDVQLAVNQALGTAPCGYADLQLNNTCTVVDVQVIVVDTITHQCLVPSCPSPLTYPSTLPNPSTAPACPPALPANPNPPNSTSQDSGPFHACMAVINGVRYQAVEITGNGGQTLNGTLYSGGSCGYEIDPVYFGTTFSNSTFWFIHFWDQPSTSATYTLGNGVTSKCIDYSKVPDC